jgi:phosphoribosyl-dephospho-CoA transferase
MAIDATTVFVESQTLAELQDIMAALSRILDEIKRADIDELQRKALANERNDIIETQLKPALQVRRDSVKKALEPYYKGLSSFTDTIEGLIKKNGVVPFALTQRIVENDISSAEDMAAVTKYEQVRPFFFYNMPAEKGAEELKTRADAEKYLLSRGYTPATIARIRFVDSRTVDNRMITYTQAVDHMAKALDIEDANVIGMAAIENEFTRTASDKGVLLEVGAIRAKDGKPFYATMYTIQTLLNVMAQFNRTELKLDNAVPHVVDGQVKGAFIFRPVAPLNYNEELKAHHWAMEAIGKSA